MEEMDNRQIISLEINLEKKVNRKTDCPEEGWALPFRKPNRTFSDKQRDYLKNKFDEGVSGVRHWKPKEVVADMEIFKVENRFYFSADEILTESQIRSLFGRMKRERQNLSKQYSNTFKVPLQTITTTDLDNRNDLDENILDFEEAQDNSLDFDTAVEELMLINQYVTDAEKAVQSLLS